MFKEAKVKTSVILSPHYAYNQFIVERFKPRDRLGERRLNEVSSIFLPSLPTDNLAQDIAIAKLLKNLGIKSDNVKSSKALVSIKYVDTFGTEILNFFWQIYLKGDTSIRQRTHFERAFIARNSCLPNSFSTPDQLALEYWWDGTMCGSKGVIKQELKNPKLKTVGRRSEPYEKLEYT